MVENAVEVAAVGVGLMAVVGTVTVVVPASSDSVSFYQRMSENSSVNLSLLVDRAWIDQNLSGNMSKYPVRFTPTHQRYQSSHH